MIITEYKYFNINIKNQMVFDDNDNKFKENPNRFKTYKLIYQIYQYEKLYNQDKNYVKKLRKSGIKVITKKKKISNRIVLEYFKEYAVVNKSFEYRKRLVETILRKEIFEKEIEVNIISEFQDVLGELQEVKTLHSHQTINNRDFFNYQNRKNVRKKTTDELMDEYLIILDTISSYLMCDSKLANCMNNNNIKEINFNEQINKSIQRHKRKQYSSTPKQTLEQYNEWKNKNKLQVKRWRKSKTYKLNNIYSYTYGETKKVWDWLKQNWVEHKSPFNLNIKRLIDPLKPKIVKWCLVDTDNIFKFNNQKFSINNEIKGYKVNNKAIYTDNELNEFTNEAKMDKILCFYVPHEDKYYFFDENIDRINCKFIKNIN